MAEAEEKAYAAIRSGIAGGRLRSGAHLSAGDFAIELGISRTPVREALRRLHAEGLVNFVPNRGAYVTSWAHKDIEEVFGLRTVLESHAAELAAGRLTAAELERLHQLARRMESLADTRPQSDLDGIAEANGEFHRLIVSAAANRRLAAMIASVVEMPLVMRTFSFYSPEDLARSMAHHRELLAAFDKRDGAWAGAIMRSHLRAAYHVLSTSLNGLPAATG